MNDWFITPINTMVSSSNYEDTLIGSDHLQNTRSIPLIAQNDEIRSSCTFIYAYSLTLFLATSVHSLKHKWTLL